MTLSSKKIQRIHKLYSKGLTKSEIAGATGHSRDTVYKYLKDMKGTAKTKDFDYMLRETLKLILEGHELKKSGELAESLGTDHDTVLDFLEWLKSHGIRGIFKLRKK